RIGAAERDGRDRPADIARRHHRPHTRHDHSLVRIDRADAPMGDRAAHDRRVPLAGPVEVIDVLPAAAQEAEVLDTLDRAADEGVDSSHRGTGYWACTAIFASRMTLAQRASSCLIRAIELAGLLASGSKPSVSRRWRVSGNAMILAISRWSSSTISFGVAAGARMISMVSASWSLAPASAMVGRSGRVAGRLALVTASARRLPALARAAAGGNPVKAIGVWPAMADCSAGPAPPNGTCTMSRSNDSRNSSPERCGVVATPAEAKLALPVLRTWSISSPTVLTGRSGFTTRMLGETAEIVIAVRSFSGS